MSSGTATVVGQSFIGRDIPFHMSVPLKELENLRPFVNAVVLSESNRQPDGYRNVACWTDGYADFHGTIPNERICLYNRPGQCSSGHPLTSQLGQSRPFNSTALPSSPMIADVRLAN